jgi:sulfur carrier protein ThiS
MMPATLKPIGALARYCGGRESIAVESGVTVREALSRSGISPELVALVLVNQEHRRKDYVVRDGDVIEVLAVVGGG